MRDGTPQSDPPRAATGIAGLDDILGGGFPRDRLYLIEGNPGTGKTTLAMQFLLEGARQGESVMHVVLAETRDELAAAAASHGWTLDGVNVFQLPASEQSFDLQDQYTIVHPAEIQLGVTTKALADEIDRVRPSRLVFDSLSELRLLTRDPLRYRHQILAMKQLLISRQCTVLLLDDRSAPSGDLQLQSISHGVLLLEQLPVTYGRPRRRLQITKLRGIAYREGHHDLAIKTGGMVVYPRLVAAEHRKGVIPEELISSGNPELDLLLGGGLHGGTSTLFVGPAGSGKSTLALQYVVAAAARNHASALFIFDEGAHTLLTRAAGLGLDLESPIRRGVVTVQQVDPAELSPGEFVHAVRERVEHGGARVVVLDSLNGYLNAMGEERSLVAQLHELLAYLNEQGVLTIMVVAQHGMFAKTDAPVDVSYLADSVILTRYFEVAGHVRKAISVVKKRSGNHERTIRQLTLGPGITLGPPLENFQGVLTGDVVRIESLPPHARNV